MLLGFLSYLIGHSLHREEKTLGWREGEWERGIIPLTLDWFQTFLPYKTWLLHCCGQNTDTDAKVIKFHCNWSSYELMLARLSQLIGILCSSGHKSLLCYLGKVVGFQPLCFLVMFSFCFWEHDEEISHLRPPLPALISKPWWVSSYILH